MPTQLTADDLNDLQDALIGLYDGERGERELVIDPLVLTDDANIWTDDTGADRTYAKAGGSSAVAVYPLPLCQGDRLVSVDFDVWQELGSAVVITVYSVTQDGARTSRGTASTPGGTGGQQWHRLPIAVGYTLPVNETLVIVAVAAVANDRIGGGWAKVDTP